jgi:phage gpG-like protein
LRRELENPEDMLTSFGEALLRVNRERHRQGVTPDGDPWTKLKHPDMPQNRRSGSLNRTGRMLANLHYQVEGDTLTLGFDDDGFPAKFHHAGSHAHVIEAKNKKALKFMGIVRKRVQHPGLPARPLLGYPESDQKLLEKVTQDHIEAISNGV